MKTRILSILAAAAAFLTVLAGLDLSGIVHALPDTVATGIATVVPLLAGLRYLVVALADFVDDGQINGSFKCPALIAITALGLALLATSCGSSAGWSIRTPYGDAESGKDGIVIVPKPVVLPAK